MVLSVASVLIISVVWGQVKKFYSINENVPYDTVDFSLHGASGNCLLKSSPGLEESPLVIYGNPDLEKINPSFKFRIEKNTCKVDLDLEEYRSSSFSDGLVFAMMRSGNEENNFWKIHLDDEKIYNLDLNYGIGNANIDLSGASINKFFLRSGTADINVNYNYARPNKIEMDTFKVQVDMGSFTSKHLELANARHIIANIGFGSAVLDLEKAIAHPCHVKASVGAGNLDIIIPNKDVPIIISLKDSPLCGARLPEGFEQVEKNVYVNMAYSAHAENLLTFNVDVALGTVSFNYKE